MCCRSGKNPKKQEFLSEIKSSFKVVLIGESGVGKSSLLIRYVQNVFEENYGVTIGSAYMKISVNVDNKSINLDVWDTAGQEKYRSLISLYFRQAIAAIIVYDISNSESFQKCEYWVKAIKEKEPLVKLFLVGAKLDGERKVPKENAIEFAKLNHMDFIETSAKTGKNIENLFKIVAKSIGDIY